MPNADILTGSSCPELVTKYNRPNQRDFPQEILKLAGQHHIFQFHYNPYCETGRVDFYFDNILDKPLQITDSAIAESQTLGEASSTNKGTLALEMPESHSPATPAPAVPIRQIPLSSPPSTAKEAITLTSQEVTVSSVSTDQTSMVYLRETEETRNDRTETLKRALFSTDEKKQKKNKSEQQE